MSTPAAGRWLKLNRGKEYLKSLNVELEAVMAGKGPSIPLSDGFDPHDQAWVLRVGTFRRTGSDAVGTLIGDTVQNLRGALDHLIWDLSILDHGAWPMDKKGRELRTQFPICTSKDGPYGFDSKRVQTVQLDSISKAHRALIERFQPYVTRDDALVLLAKISNEDKHRVIQTVYSTDLASVPRIWGYTDCEPVGSGGTHPVIESPLKPNTEILRLPLTNIGAKPHVDVGLEMAVFVTFADGLPVGNTLRKAAQTTEEILEVFEPDLSAPRAQQIREAADDAHLPDP